MDSELVDAGQSIILADPRARPWVLAHPGAAARLQRQPTAANRAEQRIWRPEGSNSTGGETHAKREKCRIFDMPGDWLAAARQHIAGRSIAHGKMTRFDYSAPRR
jgi:hypothetical protein